MPQESYPPAVALTYIAEHCIYRHIQDIGFLYDSIVHAYYMGSSDVYVLSIHNSVWWKHQTLRSIHEQCMYMYIHCMTVYILCICMVHTISVHKHSSGWFDKPECMYMYILGMTVYMQCMYMETDDRRDVALQERGLRGAETRRSRKADWAWWKVKCACEAEQTCLYYVHTNIYIHVHVCTWYIQQHTFMNMYVHGIYKYANSWTCIYTFMNVQKFINMYIQCSDTYVPFCPILAGG
jgi:hypothetical protein